LITRFALGFVNVTKVYFLVFLLILPVYLAFVAQPLHLSGKRGAPFQDALWFRFKKKSTHLRRG